MAKEVCRTNYFSKIIIKPMNRIFLKTITYIKPGEFLCSFGPLDADSKISLKCHITNTPPVSVICFDDKYFNDQVNEGAIDSRSVYAAISAFHRAAGEF